MLLIDSGDTRYNLSYRDYYLVFKSLRT